MSLTSKVFGFFRRLKFGEKERLLPVADIFIRFQNIIKNDNAAMALIADMGEKLSGEFLFDKKYLIDCVKQLEELVRNNAYELNFISRGRHPAIYEVIERLSKELRTELSGRIVVRQSGTVYPLGGMSEDMEDVVGHKAHNLSKIIMFTGARVPPGFVVGINGFRKYLAYNDLFERIEALITEYKNGMKTVETVSQTIRLMVLGGDIPPELRREVLSAAQNCCPDSPPESNYFAVRSSAIGEDGEVSFAGIHDSFLNVPFRELLASYKKVLSSLYNEVGLEYRIKARLMPMEMAMGVLYQQMVKSRVAGVLYTLDPNAPEREECLLSASWGLGRTVVDGQGQVDTFRVSRNPPYLILEQKINPKALMLAPLETGLAREVPLDLQTRPSLTPTEAAAIVETALILERYFKRPLDVEWSVDEQGRLWILQARPLSIVADKMPARSPGRPIYEHYQVLLKDNGVIAYRGVGAGQVWIASEHEDLSNFPSGAVLVSPHASPGLAKAIPRASAVITDVGSPVGHMATIAREFRVPCLVDVGTATQVLKAGQEVTVDAERNVVYAGRINELLHRQLLERPTFETAYEFQLLRRLLRKIAPLSLTNPKGANFNAEGCQTFHDVIRFIHEEAIRTLTNLGQDPRYFLQRGGKRLKSSIPLDLVLIDLGGGLSEIEGKDSWVEPDQITSLPMKAMWEGLSSPQVWSTEPISVDFKGMMSSLTRTEASEILVPTISGVNLAVIGRDYVNLSLRVGYHFTVVDAGAGPSAQNNYIFFRFMGGVTDITRRSRRASLLLCIFERIGLKAEAKGDLLTARASNLTPDQLENYLALIGKLIGFARQLDVLLKDDKSIDYYCQKFFEANRLT